MSDVTHVMNLPIGQVILFHVYCSSVCRRSFYPHGPLFFRDNPFDPFTTFHLILNTQVIISPLYSSSTCRNSNKNSPTTPRRTSVSGFGKFSPLNFPSTNRGEVKNSIPANGESCKPRNGKIHGTTKTTSDQDQNYILV